MKRAYGILPVIDVRKEPCVRSLNVKKDPLQLTQILLGDEVFVHEVKEDWCFVEISSQPFFSQNSSTWKGYEGWVEQKALIEKKYVKTHVVSSLSCTATVEKKPLFLSYGTYLQVEETKDERIFFLLPDGKKGDCLRKDVVCLAERKDFTIPLLIEEMKKFLGFPYLWGGCSGHLDQKGMMGVDCSGLVHLTCRVLGRTLPRDSGDQFRSMLPQKKLEEGPFLFSSGERGIDHVVVYTGQGKIIEATLSPQLASSHLATGLVREVSLEDKWGFSLLELEKRLEKGNSFFCGSVASESGE